jgi:ATP-dependent helicase/DNAse subunit B
MQARGVSFEVAVLPGLVEKSVPRLVRQDPLLLDDERTLLNGRDGEAFLALKRSGALEERLLFILAVRSAQKAVILTAPHLNPSSGSPRTPSIYLFEAVEAVLGHRVSRLGEAKGLVRSVLVNDWVKKDMDSCGDPLEALLTAVHEARQGDSSNALAVVQDKLFYFEGCGLLKERQAYQLFTSHDGILSGVDAKTALKKNHSLEGLSISASRLETFAACPMRYFYRYVLNLKVHPEPEKVLQLQASDRGNLMHDILEKTLEKGLKEGWVAKRELTIGLTALEKQTADAFKHFEKEGVPGAPGLWQWEKEQMRSDLSRTLEAVLLEEDWTPFAFEVGFGEEGNEVPFKLKDEKVLDLQGRMDRVDISSDGKSLRVVDYKTGTAVGVKNNSVKEGTKLQLPFYLWALKNLYADKTSRQALYDFITRRGGYKRTKYNIEAAQELEPVLDQVLSTVAHGVEQGLFPTAGKACDHCDYRKLCGTGMEARGERKREDPQVKEYYGLEVFE